jgi:glucose 1-dehydrogenase
VRLAGRTALVTGAGSGIGRAIAIRFAAEGAHVVAGDLRPAPAWDPDSLDPTAEVIERAGGSAEFVAADVTRPADVERLAAAAARSGRIDILVNGAGIFGSSALLATTDAEWDQFMDVNLRSQFLACRAVIALMVSQEPDAAGVRGRVVNISSQLGVTGPPGHLAYAVSKAGVAHLTRQLAVEYAGQGVLVNAVAPGRIITGTHPGERAYLEDGTVDAATAYSLSRTPFPRLGRPADVAGAALFLASDDCTFVSGHNLMVDGGWTAY